MKEEDTRRMLFVLGKEHCLNVMTNLYQKDWQTASEIARDLSIHIATAVKYLSELYELGLVNRRVSRRKTRTVFEFQIRSPKIKIELDLKSLIDKKPRADNKPTALFSILFIMLLKSRRVVGHSVDVLIDRRLKKLENGEKQIIVDSLMFNGDLEDARDFFLKNLNGRALTEKRSEVIVSTLIALINGVIEHYESRLGCHSTESLVDVTMNKVIDVLGNDIIENDGVLSTLPDYYFKKWET